MPVPGILLNFQNVHIVIDMRVPPGYPFTRRRHFDGLGRYPDTIQHVAAELHAEGTDYLLTRRRCGARNQLGAAIPPATSRPKRRAAHATGNPGALALRPAAAGKFALALTGPRLRIGATTRGGAGTKSEPFRFEAK